MAPQRGYVHLEEAVLGELGAGGGGAGGVEGWVRIPGVLFAATTFHLFTLGCQNNVEITQIIKQLQCPILGHWKCTFFLQMNSLTPPIKGDDYMSIINSFVAWLSYSLLFQKQLFILVWPVESLNNTPG